MTEAKPAIDIIAKSPAHDPFYYTDLGLGQVEECKRNAMAAGAKMLNDIVGAVEYVGKQGGVIQHIEIDKNAVFCTGKYAPNR